MFSPNPEQSVNIFPSFADEFSRQTESPTSNNVEISPETARKLFDNGAILVILNLPPGSVFGIDMKVFAVGEKFRGIKMIPPGLHFVYYSAVSKDGVASPRTGFFHYFKKKEIMLKKWDILEEELKNEASTEMEIQRIKSNILDLDRFLGAYPYDALKNWNRLTCNINEQLLEKLQPLTGEINSVTQLIPLSYPPKPVEPEERPSTSRTHMSLEEKYLPQMKQVPGTEIRFTKISDSKYPEGSTATEITQHNMDSTYMLEQLLNSYDKEEDILGELQMALICFLIAHVYDAFEHWKKLLEVICSVDSGLVKYTSLLTTFLTLLHFQIKEIPTDFFVDITGDNNFLLQTLKIFFENVKDSNTDEKFKKFVMNFKKNLKKMYKWDFESIPFDEMPVVVET